MYKHTLLSYMTLTFYASLIGLRLHGININNSLSLFYESVYSIMAENAIAEKVDA